jgi:hypothetical protein
MECVLRARGIGDGFGVGCDGAEIDGAEIDGAGDGLEERVSSIDGKEGDGK